MYVLSVIRWYAKESTISMRRCVLLTSKCIRIRPSSRTPIRKMIGYTDENDFPNRLESWSDLLHPDDKAAVLKEYNDTINDYSGKKNYDVEYRLKAKNGEWRWFHAIGRLLRRENGVPLSYVGMFVDITDKKASGV
ncbi:MAG: PAS domain-containing protein [Lachnospiraceae bacterium]|nr:PAS domain-containing protein [Lachnospiraceae bacterium]